MQNMCLKRKTDSKPRILLIGDSIRMRYTPLVMKNLEYEANIFMIKENCQDSHKIVTHLSKWLRQAKASELKIVHFNCGLHDIKRKHGSEINQQPLKVYIENLTKIIQILRENTHAQLIWATITPVDYALHHKNKDFDRFEEDVVTYNAAALKIMEQNQIPVDDLNSVVMNYGKEKCICPDGVHMTAEGNQLLADTVTGILKKYLKLK